jgi:hypothetical protein
LGSVEYLDINYSKCKKIKEIITLDVEFLGI